jgi:2-hydroxy-6-oxonona-2,4-dienedioate hydrolase
MKRILLSLVVLLALGATGTYAIYRSELRNIVDELAASSEVVETRHGALEYVSWGEGPTVLVVHGAGGGFDQGRLIAEAFGGAGYRWIAVSRFGYLHSAMPADASTKAQAEAFVDLLDKLGIKSASFVAMSGGVPPSLQFASLFPDRTDALVLLSSAPFAPLTAASQDLPMPAWAYQALFSSDFPFWLITKIYPAAFDAVFDVSPNARANMTAPDQKFLDQLIGAFLPVTKRTQGLANEGAAIAPGAVIQLGRIKAPTLVVHARNDGINPYGIGVFTAENIVGAKFLALEAGGHLLLDNQSEVRTNVADFLAINAGQ